MMKKSIKTIGLIATMGIISAGSYLLGTTQVETVTEAKEAVPDEYIRLNDSIVDMDAVTGFTATEYGLQLYFDDGTGYYIER